MLAHALDLLLGGKPRAGIVRPGAAEAWVEGVFELPAALRGELGERLPADAEEVVLARRVSAEGRSRAYVCGRSATVGDLRELAGALVAFYGQHEHRRLTLASAQLELLDGFCGEAHLARAARVRGGPRAGARARGVARRAARAGGRARPRARPARVRARRDRGGRPVGGRGGRAASPSAGGCATSRRCAPRRSAPPRRSTPSDDGRRSPSGAPPGCGLAAEHGARRRSRASTRRSTR